MPSGSANRPSFTDMRVRTTSGVATWVATGNQAPTAGRKTTTLSIGARTGYAAWLANLAKRLECGQLAGAFGPPTAPQSGSKLHSSMRFATLGCGFAVLGNFRSNWPLL